MPHKLTPADTPTPAHVSQIVRRQLVDMGIPIRTVRTVERPPGRFATQVHAYDVPSAAEALRTLHPEHPVTEHMSFAMLMSNGRV